MLPSLNTSYKISNPLSVMLKSDENQIVVSFVKSTIGGGTTLPQYLKIQVMIFYYNFATCGDKYTIIIMSTSSGSGHQLTV